MKLREIPLSFYLYLYQMTASTSPQHLSWRQCGWVEKKEGATAVWSRVWAEIDGAVLNFYDNETDRHSNQTGSMLAGMLDWPQARRRANIRRASRAPECPLNFRLPTGLRTCSKLAALKGLREALRSLCGVRSLPQIYLGDKDLSPQRAFQRAISGGLFDLSESSEVSS